MNDETNVAVRSSLTTRGRKALWGLVLLLGVVAIIAWVGLGIGLYLGVPRDQRLVLAVAVALSTEGVFWVCAAAMGVSVFEARKRLWRRLTGRQIGRDA